jgi:hypothetical protein
MHPWAIMPVVCRGYDVYNHSLVPMLREAAGLKLDVHMTQGRNHASEMLAAADLKQVCVLVCGVGLGGDCIAS